MPIENGSLLPVNLFKVEFHYQLASSKPILIEATTTAINFYDCEDLTIKVMNLLGEPLDIELYIHEFDDIVSEAELKLHEEKYNKEYGYGE